MGKKLLKKLKKVKDETIKNLKEEFSKKVPGRAFSGIDIQHLVIDVDEDYIKLEESEVVIVIKRKGEKFVKITTDKDKVFIANS